MIQCAISFSTWLSLMGMPEYADLFESQGYDTVEKIQRLCWEDFEDIGVKRLGHLKRLQLALKKLKVAMNNLLTIIFLYFRVRKR